MSHSNSVKNVRLVFKTHLDIGFTDFSNLVLQQYLTRFIPLAMDRADELRRSEGGERYVWTVGSWLIYKFLERADSMQKRRLEQAILNGDIAWHALPFTTHTELMDASLFRFGLSISQQLDQRFGKTTIAAKMTDVPGHTIGMVPLLAEAGVKFLHLGVNPASTVPDVPPLFVWKRGASEVVVAYSGDYGTVTAIPGGRDVLAVEFTGDNHGPHSAEQVRAVYAKYRERFPGARIGVGRFDDFAELAWKARGRLPVIADEIGDTWIHGVGTDPKKVAQFRALCRLRNRWLAEPGLDQAKHFEIANFSRALLLVPEHTWGMDIKSNLAEFESYAPAALRALRQTEKGRRVEASWQEQRGQLMQAVGQLRQPQLAMAAAQALREAEAGAPDRAGMTPVADPAAEIGTAHFKLCLDPRTGAVCRLVARTDNRLWASKQNPLALFRYQTFDQADYDRFTGQYLRDVEKTGGWAIPDFSKPGMEKGAPVSRFWLPELKAVSRRDDDRGTTLLLDLAMPEEAVARFGAPAQLAVLLQFPAAESAVFCDLRWFKKSACRLPEAAWFSFRPRLRAAGRWSFTKLGAEINPLKVVRDGNRHLHAIDGAAQYRDAAGSLRIETVDAPLVAPGAPALLNFTNRQPLLAGGMHVNLYNNLWGTNFPMWYEEDARFRFALAFAGRPPR